MCTGQLERGAARLRSRSARRRAERSLERLETPARPRRARAAIFTPCLHRLRRASVEVARLTTANFIASDSAHFGGVDGSLRRAALREQVLEVGLNSWKLPRCVSADGLPCLVDEE